MDIKNMTIGQRAGIGFGSVLAIFTGVVIFVCVKVGGMEHSAHELKDDVYPVVQLANEMNLAVIQTQQWLTDISATRGLEGYDDGFSEAAAQVKNFNEVHRKLTQLIPSQSSQLNELKRAYEGFYEVGKKMAQTYVDAGPEEGNKMMDQFDGYAEKMSEEIGKFVSEWNQAFDKEINNINHEAELTFSASLYAGIIGVAIGLGLAFYLVISITKALREISEALGQGSDEVSAAAGQVSQSSQHLASGSTEQAASLEETSASLAEMASMTKKNAENAEKANTIASASRDGAENGNQAMQEMLGAMKEINASTEKISNIIKVIEEIAFQTNLLALNAAVEAARAGEAGKGFAVVAEEVRNLAQRSAAAAKDTTQLIGDSVQKVETGNSIAEKTGTILKDIVGNINEVAKYIQEISSASQEQAEGVTQVNTAVSQMDSVTQNTAANAEETASASEELAAQAETMNDIVNRLAALVGINVEHSGVGRTVHAAPRAQQFKATKPRQFQPPKEQRKTGKSKEVKPNEVIPMDGFEDF